jgi:phosphatidylglycerophosphate synthase
MSGSRMGVAGVTRAVLLAVNTAPTRATYDAVYGGESLLTRALVALSKAGIRSVWIICHEEQREKIAALIGTARTRVALDYDISPIRTGETVSEVVSRVVEQWDASFLLFETNQVVHPTFFAQVAQFAASTKPMLVVYKHVWLNEGKVAFESAFPDKFKVIFAHPESFTKIALDKSVFQSDTFDAGARPLEVSPALSSGIFSTDVVVCHRVHLQHLSWNNVSDLIQHWQKQRLLRLGFVENVWWLPVTGRESEEERTEFFWRIAFKEISGEFSKLVNSHLSKPLTFLFVRFGFSPNAISILELGLFLVSSAFLLIPQYWAMLVFAVVWQFSAGVLDRCDGEVARIRNYESEVGARFDMLIDDLRFALPFVFMTIACYRESHRDLTYLVAAAATAAWYSTAVFYHNRFLRRSGYVSIQTMGVDFLKTQAKTRWFPVFRRIQPFTKGDIRTFYIFVAAFLGSKSVLFWMLVAYAWPLGASYFFTIGKFRHQSPAREPASTEPAVL